MADDDDVRRLALALADPVAFYRALHCAAHPYVPARLAELLREAWEVHAPARLRRPQAPQG